MGFESRHRGDSFKQAQAEELAEVLARAHRLELERAREVLHRAERAAAEDPQARSVRQWFDALVAEEARAAPTTGKHTLLGDLQGAWQSRSAAAPGSASPIPGRQTLATRDGFDSVDLEGRRDLGPDTGAGVLRAASDELGTLPLALRYELAKGLALGEVALQALGAFAAGGLSDGSLVPVLLSSSPRPITARDAASMARGRPAPRDPLLGGLPWGASREAALVDAAHRRAVSIFRRELADADVDLDDPAIAAALQRTRQGEPMSDAVRQAVEARLGADFRHVRIHTDAVAASAAEALHASAFTLGEDIFFAPGAFDPSGEAGQRLLVHELTHVVQSQQGRVPTSHGTTVSRPTDALEQEAAAAYDRIATRVIESSARPPAASPQSPPSRMLLRGPGTPGVTGAAAGKSPVRDVPWLAWDAKFMISFVDGFARTCGKELTPEARAKIERDFKELRNIPTIYAGVLVGEVLGAVQSLADNITGLAHVAEWVFWQLPVIKEAKELYEWTSDPAGKATREKEKHERQQAFLEGMGQLVVQLVKDPGIVADLGEELGQVAGDHVARFFRETFASASPFEKGKMIGRGIGYVAMEIASLFVGPELLVEKVPAAVAKIASAGGKASQAIVRLMEKIPALRKLLQAAGRLGEAAEAVGAEAKLLAHLEESIANKVLKEGLGHADLERLAKLDKAVAEKLLKELPAKDVLALEQKLGKAELEQLAKTKTAEELKALPAGKPNADFVGDLRGERVTLPGVKTQKITYTKRLPDETARLRAEFDSTVRKQFLKDLANDPEKVHRLRSSGLTEAQLGAMRNGMVPQGYQVHHKLPLDDGGTNANSNLILMKNEPFHKVITNTQSALIREMRPGETRVFDFPIPDGFIYP
jgi:hypothetical protein